jgi:hypothetical protein
MSLSAREQRILSEIERDLTATEPLLGRALASMRLRPRGRAAIGGRFPLLRGGNGSEGWVIAMLAGLVLGIAVLSAGFLFTVLALVFAGTALAQLSLVAGWLAGALSRRRPTGR